MCDLVHIPGISVSELPPKPIEDPHMASQHSLHVEGHIESECELRVSVFELYFEHF